MITIVVEKSTPIVLGDKRVTRVEVHPLNFVSFVKLAEDTALITGGDRKKFNVINRRARLKRQAIPYAGDTKLAFDDLSIAQLPITVGMAINKALDDGSGEPGEVVNEKADGITSPILFKLGTPIKFKNADGEGHFAEIEFLAKTFGDIEEIVSETSDPQQILAALRTIGKPVGVSDGLQAMPSWAIDEITVADGFAMAEKVLPRFLG